MTIELTTANITIALLISFISICTFWCIVDKHVKLGSNSDCALSITCLINLTALIIFTGLAIQEFRNVNIRKQIPDKWYPLYSYLIEADNNEMKKYAIEEFKDEFGCAGGITTDGLKQLKYAADTNSLLLSITFDECVVMPPIPWEEYNDN